MSERREPLGQAVSVTAMVRCDHVGGQEGPACTDGRCLLSDRQVDEPGYLAVAIEGRHPFLEAADHQHAAMHLDEVHGREGELEPLVDISGSESTVV